MYTKYLITAAVLMLVLPACSDRDTSNDKVLVEEVNKPLDKAKEVQDVLDQAAEERRKQIEQQAQ